MTNIDLQLYTDEEIHWVLHQKNEQKKRLAQTEETEPTEN